MYKVLIVDDEIMIRRGLSKIIHWEEIGFEMAGAVGNAMEALELIKKTPVDVLLTDISMPEMTGLELIHQARKILPGLKTVVISGYSEFDYAREAIELKVENYILKPLDPKKITETFQKICKELDQEQRRERREQYLQSEYEVRRGADPEKKGCDDEWQTKMIQVLEEGRYKELDGFVDQWFLQMEKMDSRQIREYCYKSLRKAAMYFHMDTPPLFKIYQLSDQDQEKFSKILKEDMQMLASCLKDNSESFTILISSKAKNYIDVNYSKKDLSLREIADKLNVSYGYLSTAFMPYISSLVSVATVWMVLLYPDKGPVNSILTNVFHIANPPQWFISSKWALKGIIMMSVWHDVGYYCIILLANMQGLSAEVYESAAVDGANNIQTFFRITIPMMASSIFFCITLATINSFKIFDQVNIITEGGPGFSTTVLVQAIYYYAFKEYKIGYAAAVAIVLFVIIFIFSTVLQKLEEKFTY